MIPFTQADFANPTFIRVRRQGALLRLQTADDPQMVELLKRTIKVYDELLAGA